MADRNQNDIVQGAKKLTRFNKPRTLSELEDIKQSFPDYDDIPLEAEYDMVGNIISIETTNTALKAILRAKGFTET